MRKMLLVALLTLCYLTTNVPTINAGLIPVYDIHTGPYFIAYEPAVIEIVPAEDDGSYKPPPSGEDGQWTPDTSDEIPIVEVLVDNNDNEEDSSDVSTTEEPEVTTENAGITERSTDCGPDGEDGADGADGSDGPNGSKGGKGGKGGKSGKAGCPGKGGNGGDAGDGGDAPVLAVVEQPAGIVVNDLIHHIVIE